MMRLVELFDSLVRTVTLHSVFEIVSVDWWTRLDRNHPTQSRHMKLPVKVEALVADVAPMVRAPVRTSISVRGQRCHKNHLIV